VSDRPTLSAAEAARAAGVSAKTIGRALKKGKVPGAERLPSGGWALPVEGLLAAGYVLHRSEPEPVEVTPQGDPDRVRALEAEVAELRRERDVAVAVAEERAAALADVRLALRALNAGTDPEGTAVPTTAARAPEAPVARTAGRWWRRGR
jgi:hypothetical protein